jgi:hypothetical protein
MNCDADHEAGQPARVQFSLAMLLILVTLVAVVVASITELPEWIGAPLLALVATTAAAVVVGAAIRSKGNALTFYIGAAFPLCMLVVRTSLLLSALSDGIIERETPRGGLTIAQLYGENYLDQRLSYRWEAAAVIRAESVFILLGVIAGVAAEVEKEEVVAMGPPH